MWRRAKFQRTIVALLLVAAACGVATGCRGGLFTVAMSRLNVRLRKQLFHSLLQVSHALWSRARSPPAPRSSVSSLTARGRARRTVPVACMHRCTPRCLASCPTGLLASSSRAASSSLAVSFSSGACRGAPLPPRAQMEVGFFDVTKTGEITSRLAADTSTVSDQVSECARGD